MQTDRLLPRLGCLDSAAPWRVGFGASQRGGESVLVNGAVFKTVSETVRAGSGRFDSYTPPPATSSPSKEAWGSEAVLLF
jgi:hypothetical protein